MRNIKNKRNNISNPNDKYSFFMRSSWYEKRVKDSN